MLNGTLLAEIDGILRDLNTQGGFSVSVLTGEHGLPLSSAVASGEDPDAQAAVVAMLEKASARVEDRLGMRGTAEVTMRDALGRCLVCRPFSASGKEYVLSVMVPEKRRSYRQVTNRALRALVRTLGTL
jgi:predicted regulator of Ras-like GTPase activity (Roadblock/LC7/MglB family)